MPTTEEAAEVLGVTKRRVQQLCLHEKIGKKLGRDYWITDEELAELKQRRDDESEEEEE
jgi:excisionase family DNA binding protein